MSDLVAQALQGCDASFSAISVELDAIETAAAPGLLTRDSDEAVLIG